MLKQFYQTARRVSTPSSCHKPPSCHNKNKTRQIETVSLPSLSSQDINSHEHQQAIADAIRPYHQSQTPLLLANLISKCDAVYFWRSMSYWRAAVAQDTPVEVELGKSYNSGSRISMRLKDYLDYLTKVTSQEEGKEEEQVAYLAQNELFSEVQNDIPTPHFCSDDSFSVGEGKLYHSMLWLGPCGTISPLHYDPLDNLLMQVVGSKRVLLYPPDKEHGRNNHNTNSWHYAGSDGNQYNTSAVDIEHPDYDKYPNFGCAPTPYEVNIHPGDVLYIPSKWWHHVRCTSQWSASANIWWR